MSSNVAQTGQSGLNMSIEQHRGPFDKINLCGSSQMLMEYGVPEARKMQKIRDNGPRPSPIFSK